MPTTASFKLYTNGSLSQLPRRQGDAVGWAWPLLGVARGVASALAYLHSAGGRVAHGDVRPSNVLLDDDYAAVLADF